MHHIKDQRGMSMMGFVFVAVVLSMVAMVVIKVLPFYQEYSGITRSINQLKQVPDIQQSSESTIIGALLNKFYINEVRSIKANNLKEHIRIEPFENTYVLQVDYMREAPLFQNMFIVTKFKEDFKL